MSKEDTGWWPAVHIDFESEWAPIPKVEGIQCIVHGFIRADRLTHRYPYLFQIVVATLMYPYL